MNDFPSNYIPKSLSYSDRIIQSKNLKHSTNEYKKGKYIKRENLSSFVSKPSGHVINAKRMYNVDSLTPSPTLSKHTGCPVEVLNKIVNKGRGAYYSSGSRPNQTPESWGLARLGSTLTGGPSSVIDYHILQDCKKGSKPLTLAKKACKKKNKTCNRTVKKKTKYRTIGKQNKSKKTK